MENTIRERLKALSVSEYSSLGAQGVQSLYAMPGRFIIERRRVSLISTGRVEAPISLHVHPMKVDFPVHSHDYIELMYVYSGEISHKIAEETVTVSEGEVILFGKGAEHSISPTGEEDLGVNIIISTEVYERLISDLRRSSSLELTPFFDMLEDGKCRYLTFDTGRTDEIHSILDLLVESALTDAADTYVVELTAKLLLAHLSASITEGRKGDKERILADYIHTSYASATLAEAAKLVGFTEAYLSRWFHEHFGVTFKEMLMEERFMSAMKMLAETDIPIGTIIANVGYENSSYFHKEFKRRLGITPKEYRKQETNGKGRKKKA